MAFSFITATDLKAAVARYLQQANPANLNPNWDGIVSDALDQSYRDIQGALGERGYSVAQIQTWAEGAAVQKTQGLYWALVLGAGLHSTEPWTVKQLDQRTSLKTAPVNSINSDPTGPGASPGVIQVGQLTETDADLDPLHERSDYRWGSGGWGRYPW
jgi:hypothetical protein